MSKINKIRFVNLNYNYNTMKIDDEKFYLDGENTMLNLRNGGGKSVLVQMIMAPFVNRRYRNTKDRAFESYFTSGVPTYILIEWKLDDGAGYLLTGMMVRKKEAASDENSKERLDIINFVHEYREKNEYDINSIPIIEEKNDRKMIKSFANCKSLFEALKKDRELKFNYYDMNNPVTTKNYFNKLEEYKINYREWETIIKQINIKESGLSELFTKAKDSNGLVKEWFLPAVENKLKVDDDRIDNYRQLLDSYIKQYRQNKANIDKKAKLELFNELSKDILICCEEFILTAEKREEIKNYIANVIVYLREKLEDKEKEEAALEQLIESLNDKIIELQYEEESIKVYKKQEEIDSLEADIKKHQELVNESEFRKNSLIREGNILECAKIHRQYQDTSKELLEQETKLANLHKKNEDNAPHIINLGFTIRGILQKELDTVKKQKSDKLQLNKNLEEEKETINNSLKINRNEINNLNERKGSLSAEISSFDKLEEGFNRSSGFNLFRNIEAYFDEERLLSIDKEINDEGNTLDKERKNVSEKILQDEEKLKSKESEKIRNLEKNSDVKNKLNNKNSELEKAEEEIERRKEIIKFIDFEEDKVFDNESIINAFDRKIDLLKEDEVKLKKLFDNLNSELIKLKTGKVLELSKDIEEKLREKDISITYGMEWLKKNGYQLEKNEKLVKDNPFIPYSLIMDSKEIELLEKELLDIFTSSPISIINRKDLEKSFANINAGVAHLNGVSFFISFNNKLLNERELLKLIDDKAKEAQAVQAKINEKSENIAFYEEKRNIIKYSALTLEVYEGLKKEISNLKVEASELREIEIALEKSILSIKDELKNCKERVQLLEKDIQKSIDKAKAFKELLEAYEKYKKNKISLERVLESLSVINNHIDKAESRISDIEKEIKECNSAINFYNNEEEKASKELAEFNIYKSGTLIEKDKEDLISEYNALTKDITSSEKELRDSIKKLNEKFDEIHSELTLKADKYEVKEAEYINETFDTQKEFELKDELQKENKKYNNLKDEYNKFDKAQGIAVSKLEDLKAKLKAKFNKDEPKAKNLLIDKDFKLEIEKLKLEIVETNSKKAEVNKVIAKIENNLTSLNEFNDLNITDKVDVNIDLNELDSFVGKLKRDLNNVIAQEIEREKNLTNLVVDVEIKDEFKQESLFKEPIQTLKSLIGKPREFKEQLNLVINSYGMIMEKLMADIELIEKEEGKILESILEYIKDVHENIEKIDDNSSITIGAKRLKMLNISVSAWEENKELYKVRLKEYIERIREQSIKALEQNEDIEDIISNNININKLYDEVVGIGTVNIKLYKIEEDKQRQISWDEVSKNSGGEGFLSAFVILSSLLSYMRKDDSDIFSRKESGKVLIMDNPFAQTSSAHLLKPLVDIAKKSNTQLICLTGLGGDSIYNRFDNIYVLNLISSKLKSGVKYLKSEHTKGEEEKEEIVASRFKIEEQIKLF
ncbi:hypothetical protein [Clostridium pasteurianum]|uniref:Chromosome segregation ATPase n=1 Tax=Clostridium pasteurianum BC1 TaxID=86416 RepID=R4K605_CLOPA|nr:hypothetical protein [Clostridium pasteurianum]AGK98602.1 hypothetical protein Clopa_3844 [Clostridium pasteurianum BC1]